MLYNSHHLHPRQVAKASLPVAMAIVIFLSGCTLFRPTTRPARYISDNAMLMARVSGTAAFVMPDAGKFVILDDHTGALVFSTDVFLNQQIVFMPDRNQIIVNGAIAQEGGLDAERTYRFYFDKEDPK